MTETIKGRGSRHYLPGRFEVATTEAVDDGWDAPAGEASGPDPLRPRTEVESSNDAGALRSYA